MAFDLDFPPSGAEALSAEFRGQFNGLKELIDNVPAGPQGAQGPPGEVSQQQLGDGLAGCSSNSNGVTLLEFVVENPPTQAQVQAVADKVNELILALRR